MRLTPVARRVLALALSAAAAGAVLTPAPAAAEVVPAPRTIATLGDSITRGANACGAVADCTAVSWAGGTHAPVRSHAARFAALTPASTPRVLNNARSGAVMSGLPAQAAATVRQGVDHVTVLMGGNDACRPTEAQMTSVESFRASAQTAMDTLRTGAPDATVVVASVPDVKRLWAAARHVPKARTIWSVFRVCQSMLANPLSTAVADEARRERVRARIVGYNAVLAQVCATHPRCRYDGGAVFGHPFSLAEISSLDYFHPSVAGQAAISAKVWAAGTAQP